MQNTQRSTTCVDTASYIKSVRLMKSYSSTRYFARNDEWMKLSTLRMTVVFIISRTRQLWWILRFLPLILSIILSRKMLLFISWLKHFISLPKCIHESIYIEIKKLWHFIVFQPFTTIIFYVPNFHNTSCS